MADQEHSTRVQRATLFDVRWAIAVLAVAVVAAVGGYVLGTNRSGVSVLTGKAYSTQAQISITGNDGWVYNVPLDVNWTDASGGWHDGDRPTCLPPDGQLAGSITFAATDVTVSGFKLRPVVWVSCRG